jgi:hypothetical protein
MLYKSGDYSAVLSSSDWGITSGGKVTRCRRSWKASYGNDVCRVPRSATNGSLCLYDHDEGYRPGTPFILDISWLTMMVEQKLRLVMMIQASERTTEGCGFLHNISDIYQRSW